MSMRNIAIIAHVDHGKTTLVDKLLQQSGTYRDNQRIIERVDGLQRPREGARHHHPGQGTSVVWKDTRINIVDTPGHADFGGEVERILNMVDLAIVLVDAAEGPMPQTKFVVSQGPQAGLRPIVVINKVDKPDARVQEVINEVFDLFAALDANDEQLDFPILYGRASRAGWRMIRPVRRIRGLAPMYDLILSHVPEPRPSRKGPFRMLGTLLEANPYLGRIITGRVVSGSAKPNQQIKVLSGDGSHRRNPARHHQDPRLPRP